jgi:hypothetical protein
MAVRRQYYTDENGVDLLFERPIWRTEGSGKPMGVSRFDPAIIEGGASV